MSEQNLDTLTLRERAALALAEQRENEAARAATQEQNDLAFRAHVLKRLLKKILDVDVTPDSDRVDVDGLRFGIASHHGDWLLVMFRPCPACGEGLASRSIYSLVRLAEMLESETFTPLWDHECPAATPVPAAPKAPPPPSAAHNAVSALAAYIRETVEDAIDTRGE